MKMGMLLAVVAAVLVIVQQSTYLVYETEQTIVLRFGNPVRLQLTPGLKFKIPFIEEVKRIDRRVLDLDTPPQEVQARGQKRLVVDAFIRYRINDPLLFYQRSTGGSVARANLSLTNFLDAAVRRVLGQASFTDIVRDRRPQLMALIAQQMNEQAADLGISVLDVRIRRADLPTANSKAIYQRMRTERQRAASEIRALGEEASRRIRANADRQVKVVIGNANQKSAQIRGEGDAERIRVFANAFGKDPEFFNFWRSTQAYAKALTGGNTRFVMSPNSEFFQYMSSPNGGNLKDTSVR